ncbi:MAG: molybdopterin-containing oxidoreductase family protein [Sporichthyaceae bacterium]
MSAPKIEEKSTYCRICEPMCGLIATVEDGRLVKLRADKDDPHSKGFSCTKGVAMTEVVNDPDRITVPMRRVGGPGEFEPCTWDEALDDIAARFKALRSTHGKKALAVHEGNPPYFSYSAAFWGKNFACALGTPWFYGINSEDGASRVAAYKILYGHMAHMAIPDIPRADVMLVLGANPWVSKGSFVHDPRIREHMTGIIDRGGRIFVVDPRRTQTAKAFTHVPIKAGTDAQFLLSVLHVIVAEKLHDEAFLARWTSGFEQWRHILTRFAPEVTQAQTGIPAETVREVARAIGTAKRAVVYGRTGTCTQEFGTLNNVLQDFINIVTGNLQTPGGWVWAWSPVETAMLAEKLNFATFDKVRTRVSGLPDAYGFLPSSALPEEILTPGEGQIRGMMMLGSNPVVTGPSGQRLAHALQQLEIFAAVDLYLNETNSCAHYLLPATSMYEREDVPIQFANRYVRPSLRITEKVIEPIGQCRQEWEILDDLCKRMGLGGAHIYGVERFFARFGLGIKPQQMADLLIRTGKGGDLFGLRRSGWSWKKLATKAPRGVVFHEVQPLAPLKKFIRTPDRKIPMTDPRIMAELARLEQRAGADAAFPLRMIGMREMNSHNSWMHNSPRLMPDSRKHGLRINPRDAAALGLLDGAAADLSSASATIRVEIMLSEEMVAGTVALPHGWGHDGGWQRANAAGGSTSNFLSSQVEVLSGISVLNGIPVNLTPVRPTGTSEGAAAIATTASDATHHTVTV